MSEPETLLQQLAPMIARMDERMRLVTPLSPERAAEIAREIAEQKWHAFCRAAGIPRRLWSASLDAGMPSIALDRVRRYLGDEYEHGGCLVLAGPTGAGKSYAAVAALRHVGAGLFRYWPAVCGALLNPETRTGELHELKTPRLLVLDDVGTEYLKTDGLVEAFFDEVVWYREGNCQPTVLTTNLTTDALKGRWSARIVDRIRGEWGAVTECPGESMRIST